MNTVLEVENLQTQFETKRGVIPAVADVSLSVGQGEIVALVGESGSGKTVTGLSIMGLVPSPGRIVGGRVLLNGTDLLKMSRSELRGIRGRGVAMVFQNPLTALDPSYRVGKQFHETLREHGVESRDERNDTIDAVLRDLQFGGEHDQFLAKYQHELSAGMRQRLMIAMALMLRPSLLIADEPTSALSGLMQLEILKMLRRVNKELGTAILLVTHDFGVVAALCDRIAVMYAGRIVEVGTRAEVLSSPRHPYTVGLVNSVPRIDSAGQRLFQISGQPPDLLNLPSGCSFAPRCLFATDACSQMPELEPTEKMGSVRCWNWRDVTREEPMLDGPASAIARASR